MNLTFFGGRGNWISGLYLGFTPLCLGFTPLALPSRITPGVIWFWGLPPCLGFTLEACAVFVFAAWLVSLDDVRES